MTSTAKTKKCHACRVDRDPHQLKVASTSTGVDRRVVYRYCADQKACRDKAVQWTTEWQPGLKWFVKYGVWIVLGVVFLAWELLGVKSLRRVTGMGERDHPSLSEVVWELEGRFGVAGRVVVGAFMADLTVHFLAHTPLIPGVG